MGILDGVGYALGAAADTGAAGMMDQFRSQLEQDRQIALASVRQKLDTQTHRENVDYSTANADASQIKRSADIEQGAGIIAGRRSETSPQVDAQADQAALAYDDARQKGLISQTDANAGYGAAADYREQNSTQGSAVTDDDRKSAAIQKGYIDPKEAAILGNKDADREIKTAIAQGRFENALQIAQMKGDFGMALGEMKAAASGGSEKATTLMKEWNFLTKEKGYTDERAAKELLGGKDMSFETVSTEGFDKDGNKVTTTKKVAAGHEGSRAAAPTADKFIVGKKYKDASGNVSTYAGNGKWN